MYRHAELITGVERMQGMDKRSNYLLGIICRECAKDVFSSLDYLLYRLCNIWGWMCSTDPFVFRWLRGYICNSSRHHQIKRNILSYCCHIFRGCASDVIIPSYDVSCTVKFMTCASICMHYGLKVILFVCISLSTADFSESTEFTKCSSVFFTVECVTKI